MTGLELAAAIVALISAAVAEWQRRKRKRLEKEIQEDHDLLEKDVVAWTDKHFGRGVSVGETTANDINAPEAKR